MTEPAGPPSLFKLALDVMLKAAKDGKFCPSMDLLQIVPPIVRKIIWDHCTLMEIITLSSAMDTTEFFSLIVRSHADDIAVHFDQLTRRLRALVITCAGKPMLMWHIVLGSLPNGTDSTFFQLKIGEVYSPTNMIFGSTDAEAFDSYFPHHHAVLEAGNWAAKLFQKVID